MADAVTLAEKIAVMQAAERGEQIECLRRDHGHGWQLYSNPKEDLNWNWEQCEYRVKPKPAVVYLNMYGCEHYGYNSEAEALEAASRASIRTAVRFVECPEEESP